METLEANKLIERQKLPKSFQDAIQVARSLSLEYIWIDSLCIVQDDLNDWIRESKNMCAIYESSWLTIAATAAVDGTVGISLKEKRGGEVSGTTSAGAELHFIFCKSPHSHPPARYHRERENEFPLFHRAWIFQERMLSPRVLHFGETELFSECRQKHRCECEVKHLWDPDQKREYHAAIVRPSTASLVRLW